MKSFIKLISILLSTLFFLVSCDDSEDIQPSSGEVTVDFDNIAIIDGVQKQLQLVEPGNQDYQYENEMGQAFNLTMLKYFVSAIILEGPDGAYYEEPLDVTASGAEGYYLIDESEISSQKIVLENVPSGKYNKVSFTIGVDEEGVVEGTAGGSLDPATNGMFWNWNAGYVALKLEGHSEASAGGAHGNTVNPEIEHGMVFHIGGWRDIEGTAFIYNNKRLEYTFDTELKVDGSGTPNIHMTMDVLGLFNGDNTIDFSGNNSIHKPTDGAPFAENFKTAFAFDHIHE